MGAIADLWKSERGLVAVLLIIAMSVLTGIGVFTGAQWIDYTKWLATVYIGSKTVTGAVQLFSAKPPTTVTAPAASVYIGSKTVTGGGGTGQDPGAILPSVVVNTTTETK